MVVLASTSDAVEAATVATVDVTIRTATEATIETVTRTVAIAVTVRIVATTAIIVMVEVATTVVAERIVLTTATMIATTAEKNDVVVVVVVVVVTARRATDGSIAMPEVVKSETATELEKSDVLLDTNATASSAPSATVPEPATRLHLATVSPRPDLRPARHTEVRPDRRTTTIRYIRPAAANASSRERSLYALKGVSLHIFASTLIGSSVTVSAFL